MSRRVLILLAHPLLERSFINARFAAAAASLTGVTVHDLYEAYPNLSIDRHREQQLLDEHDAVVFQHPMYWYSTPAILKQWQDLVLEHNWAYGGKGNHLDGKVTFNVVSTGGPQDVYRPGGRNRFTVRQLLAPYELTAQLCRMVYLAPFVTHGAFRVETESDLRGPLNDYQRVLTAVRDDQIDLAAAAQVDRLNDSVQSVLRTAGAPA